MPEALAPPSGSFLRLFRAAPFRLTLLTLALFAFAGAVLMAYVYMAAAGEARRRTDAEIRREADSLVAVYDRAGPAALNPVLVTRMAGERRFVYLFLAPDGARRPFASPLVALPRGGIGSGGPSRWCEGRFH